MIIKTGLSNFSSGISNASATNGSSNNNKSQIGKVFGVITTENSPTKELFDANGGWGGIGTVFYLDYENSKDISSTDLNKCKIAKPFHASQQNYPLIGELIHIIDGPSPTTQLGNFAVQKYYTGTINLWNNNQQNAPSGDTLGKTFTEKADIRNLYSFEGDRIFSGRKGNGLRFGSTVKLKSNINEWSNIGNDGDPITILVNGYVTTDTGSLSPNIEEINKEQSSIYLTTTQVLPLQPGVSIINPRVNTTKPSNYNSSQAILNSDRITLNAKKDEVLLFAKGNIELSTDNIINLNAGEVVHINSPFICLGTTSKGDYPIEPVVLGGQLSTTFDLLIKALSNLASSLSTAIVPTTEGGIPIPSCNEAGAQLFADLKRLNDQIEKCLSDNVYTI
jgi:hypothetical protein